MTQGIKVSLPKPKGRPEIAQVAYLGGQKILQKYGRGYLSYLGKRGAQKRHGVWISGRIRRKTASKVAA